MQGRHENVNDVTSMTADTDDYLLESRRRNSGNTQNMSETPNASQTYAPTYNKSTTSHSHVDCEEDRNVVSLNEMLVPRCQDFDTTICDLLQTATASPPVTRATLSELDLNWIMHNVSLRVDVNYDHDLHFMPIKGSGGEQKQRDAQIYWNALATELQIYQHDLSICSECLQSTNAPQKFRQRLPAMFEALKELLETLVPDRDHSLIAENLDIPLLMQEIRNGVLDIARLSRWAAELLKSHCAPMRDEWADQMALRMEEGVVNSDMNQLVEGLEKLFSFLEAMKLDVANHQIRTFRYPLIEDTVSFQQNHFARKLQAKKICAEPSRQWYRVVCEEHKGCQSDLEQSARQDPSDVLIHGILKTLTQRVESQLPTAFTYDIKRLRDLREDVQDSVYSRICLVVFNSFIFRRIGAQPHLQSIYHTLEVRLMAIVDKDMARSRGEMWQAQVEDLAMEITRAAYIVCGHAHYHIPDDDFEWTTICLQSAFASRYEFFADEMHTKLEQMTLHHASVFHEQSALQISEDQRQWQQTRQDKGLRGADTEDIARRVAHMGVLHWRVWAGLVYLSEGEDETMPEEENELRCHQSQDRPDTGDIVMGTRRESLAQQRSVVDDDGGGVG